MSRSSVSVTRSAHDRRPLAARRHRPGRAGPHRPGHRRRTGDGGHRTDRGAEPGAERRRHAHLRPGARRGREQPCRPVRRGAISAQGPGLRDGRRAVHRGFGVPGRQRLRVRPRARGAAAQSGPGHTGQDQHARVRHGPGVRAGAVRPGPQPMGHATLHQRIQRRIGRGGGVRHGAVRPRQRPGRLATVPGVRMRTVRPQADPGPQPARARVRRRRRRRCRRARAHPVGPGQRRAARRHLGPGRGRSVLGAAAGTPVRRRGGPTRAGCVSPAPPGHQTATAAIPTASPASATLPACAPRSGTRSPKPAGPASPPGSARPSAR